MTNFEKYKKEIKEMIKEGIRVSVVNKKPKNCHETECHKCDLYKSGNCQTSLIEWLYKEYTELKPTLTRTERNFIESFRHPENKVLIRDNSGLYINYDNKPEIRYFSLKKDMFKFIKINETWSVEDLLKLEVEE